MWIATAVSTALLAQNGEEEGRGSQVRGGEGSTSGPSSPSNVCFSLADYPALDAFECRRLAQRARFDR